MNDLEKFAPPEQLETITRIYDWHKKTGDAEERRTYLGGSILGTECERELWYAFRWCSFPDFSGRSYRLFETGDAEEPRLVRDLRAIGVEVYDVDPDTDEQFGVSAIGGHVKGHLDGIALGILEAPKTWHVLEFKTHGEKSYKELEKKGVKESKPVHYAQMMLYMGLMKLTRALYLAKNKNTEEIYGERIRFDADEFARLKAKAKRIVEASHPPERISNRQDSFACRFCDANELCWNTNTEKAVALSEVSCRSCCHATPETDESDKRNVNGRWTCNRHNRDLTKQDQMNACDDHLLLPDLIPFAAPVDAGNDFIEFQNNEDGAVWRHGKADGQWSTKELISGLGPLGEANPIEVEPEDIFDRYPPEDCREVWSGANDGKEIEAALLLHDMPQEIRNTILTLIKNASEQKF